MPDGIDESFVFPGSGDGPDDETAVRRDIVLLTNLLRGGRSGESGTTFKSNINGIPEYAVWSHVASVFSAWGPGNSGYPDNNDAAAMAVTGRLEADRVVGAIFTLTEAWDGRTVLGVACSSLAAEEAKFSADEVEHPLNNLDNLRVDVPLATHLRDVISILEWLSRVSRAGSSRSDDSNVPPSRRRWDYTSLLFCFIVKRGYRRLYAHLQTGKALWQGHPLTIIHEFYCQCTPSRHPGSPDDHSCSVHEPHPLPSSPSFAPPKLRARSHLLRNLFKFRHLLERHGIHPERVIHAAAPVSDPDSGTYVVSSSTAAAWADILRTCYTTLLASVSRAAGESPTELEANCPMTEAECTALCAAMVALREMLRAGIVNQLITEAVRKELDRRYTQGPQGTSTSLFARAMDSAGADADNRPFAPDVGVECDPGYLQWDGELPRRHVLRYLQSLVQPLSTAIEIVAHLCDNLNPTYPLKLDVSRVQVAAKPLLSVARVSGAYYDGFVDRLLRSLDVGSDDGRIFARMQRALRLVKEPLLAPMAARATVHPEAALMTLGAGGWRSSTMEDEATKAHLHDVFAGGISRDNTPVILDAGKRCCYCCALLAQLLRPWSESVQEGSARTLLRPLKFVLEPDGTHGIIMPWLPPADIPLHVLREIRARLLGVLGRDIAAVREREKG